MHTLTTKPKGCVPAGPLWYFHIAQRDWLYFHLLYTHYSVSCGRMIRHLAAPFVHNASISGQAIVIPMYTFDALSDLFATYAGTLYLLYVIFRNAYACHELVTAFCYNIIRLVRNKTCTNSSFFCLQFYPNHTGCLKNIQPIQTAVFHPPINICIYIMCIYRGQFQKLHPNCIVSWCLT